MSAAVCLWRLLEHCELEEMPYPTRTRSIVVDDELLAILCDYLEIPIDVAVDAFEGVPIKEARGVATWARTIGEEDRIGALRARARKRRGRGLEAGA